MGIRKKIEEGVIGKIIKDYGTFEESFFGLQKIKYNILLTEADNKQWVVMKRTMGLSLEYSTLSMENAQRLREILDDALKTPPSSPLKPGHFD